jgi:hypothetical protein
MSQSSAVLLCVNSGPIITLKDALFCVKGSCLDFSISCSQVVFYGLHYAAFIYNAERRTWQYADDANVRMVGSWDELKEQCERGALSKPDSFQIPHLSSPQPHG